MSEQEREMESHDSAGPDELNVTDNRKFSADGERQEGVSPDETLPPIVAKLEEEIRLERERREAAEHKLVGVQAKFDEMRAEIEKDTAEMRQRMQRNNEQRMQIEKAEFLAALLPILDNINLAVQAARQESSVDNLLAGVSGVARLFEQTLVANGVEPIVSIGAAFDPELHEAVDLVAVDSDNDGKIVGEFAKGYRFGDRLLRPAKVQVGKSA